MKKILLAIILFLCPLFAQAQLNVVQGGTGLNSVPNNYVLIGNNALHLQAVATTSLGLPGGNINDIQTNNGSGGFYGDDNMTYDGSNMYLGSMQFGSEFVYQTNAGSPDQPYFQLADDAGHGIYFNFGATNPGVGSDIDFTAANGANGNGGSINFLGGQSQGGLGVAGGSISFQAGNTSGQSGNGASMYLQPDTLSDYPADIVLNSGNNPLGNGYVDIQAGNYETRLDNFGLSNNRTFSFPDETGTPTLGGGNGVSGDCASWSDSNTLTDIGAPCGSSNWSTTSQNYYDSQFNQWIINSAGALTPTTTIGVLLNSSTTLQNFTGVNATTTNATTTNLYSSVNINIATTSSSGVLNIGNDIGSATTTIEMGKIQFSGYTNTNTPVCVEVVGTTFVILAKACTP